MISDSTAYGQSDATSCSRAGIAPARRRKIIRIWTSAEEHQLRAMAGTLPIVEIARRMNRTRASVLGKAHLIGVSLFHVDSHPATRYPQATYQAAMRLYDAGWSYSAIAAELNVKSSIVPKWVNYLCRTGIPINS